ncbi:response regulator [bacterium]|nr:response regulator [bacterium]
MIGENNEYKCLIVDIFMPEIDGIDLYHNLFKNQKIESVIFMSGCDVSVFADRIKNINYLEIISKPFDLGEVLRIINKHLTK